MAPTSIKGANTMGIYTTRDIKANEYILTAPDGPSITLLTDSFRARSSKFPDSDWIRLWGNYAWGRGKGVPDHVAYEAYAVMDFQITTGALPNHHCLLDAIDFEFPWPSYDDSRVNHRESPGTGAFSYNRGRDFMVHRDVQGGEELFLNYGLCTKEKIRDWGKDLPLPSHDKDAVNITSNAWKKLSQNKADEDDKVDYSPHMDSVVAKIVPKSVEEMKNLMSLNYNQDELMRELARRTEINHRTPEWIRTHGQCVEHMRPAPSQIPHAGFGGLAQHFISKGSVIVPAPLMHIMDQDVLAIYDDGGKKTGDQLLLNYCFGHHESSLLLCPNTNAILINHCGSRTKNCRPNAKMRWSQGWDKTSDEWRKESLNELSKKTFRGLSMDIVALHNIVPGEEIFMDYGVEWENAWQKHVKEWKVMEPVMSAKEANDANYQSAPPAFIVTGDLRPTPKDKNKHLFAGCLYWKTSWDSHRIWSEENPEWTNLTDAEILQKYSDNGSQYVGSYRKHYGMAYWPCLVVRPEDETKSTFIVRILQNPFMDEQPWEEHHLPRFLTNYPRKSIHFFVRKNKADQYLPGVFRHKIGIPDEIFPSHWKNLAM